MNSTSGYEPKVIVVGYSPKLRGGVTQVTSVLLQNFENMELHPSLYCYSPKYKAIICYLFSVLTFACKICRIKQRSIIHLIIGSSGDAIRSVPYIWLSRIMRLKLCVQYHTSAENILSKISSIFLFTLVKNSLQRLDVHCFLSKRLKNGFDEVLPNRFQSKIIPNALDKKWIETQVLSKNKRNRDIVFLGRWSWEKGVEDLLACMAKVKSDVCCEFYSNHIPPEVYKNCQFFPWVNETDVMKIMQTAKLLVLPSYAEAYPTVLLEAAACGTPFLASNIGGIPDIAEASGGGRVFDVGNVKMMAEIIDEMLADEVKWIEMSNNGKEWITTLSEENIKKKWQKVYSLLESDSIC